MENKSVASTSAAEEGRPSSSQKPPLKPLRQLIAEERNKALRYTTKKSYGVEVMDQYEAVNNYKEFQEKKTGYVEQESRGHYCVWDRKYPENPERVACARRRLEQLDLIKRCERIIPETFPEDIFLQKHTKKHFEYFRGCSEMNIAELREESCKWDSVFMTPETFEDAKLSAEAALTLTLKVARGKYRNGFALIRPPGHHAMANAFCGYCFLNNVAISADRAISDGLAKRVLIVDYDIHHGQGVQQLFYDRDDVLYFSIHRYEQGEFWPHLRESDTDFIGSGRGRGYNVNVPLNKTGLGDSDYLAIVFNLLLPLAYEGQMLVTPHFYGHVISLLSGLANGKLVVLLEGGYFQESLAEGVACTLKSLLGDVCYPTRIQSNPTVDPSLQAVINNVKYFLRDNWKCFQTEEMFDYPRQGNLEINVPEEHVTCLDFTKIVQDTDVYETFECYPIQSDDAIDNFTAIIQELREIYSISRVCDNTVGYVYDESLLNHKPTSETGKCPPERPERLVEIMKRLEEFGLTKRCKLIEPVQLDEKVWLEKTHEEQYIRNVLNLKNITEKVDWYFNDQTANAIVKSISCILSLAQSISEGSVRAGAAIIRPPGHHASRNTGSGFCFANNVVVAAQYLTEKLQYERVLIVDFDIHHGNGTQDLTYKRSDILYISVHRFDENRFFPACEEADYTYTGKNDGVGYNVNIPFNKDKKTNVDYWTVWYKLVLPIAYSYNPDFVIISAGFDAGIYDPIGGGYQLTPEMYGQFVQTLKGLASGRILLALEGGYHLETTALSMVACVKALLGDPIPVPAFSEVSADTLKTIKNVVGQQKAKWPMLELNKRIANFWCTKTQMTKLQLLSEENPSDSISRKIKELTTECKNNSTGSYDAK